MLKDWRKRELGLDLERLKTHHYDHAKIPMTPWDYSAKRRIPSLRWQRRIVAALVDIHDAWFAQLSQLGEPFYLAIWVFLPDFSNSQVVASVRGRLHYYDETFEAGIGKPFPAHLEPGDLKWTHRFELEYQSVEHDFPHLPGDDVRSIKKNASYIQESEGDTLYWVRRNHVWVGKK